MPWFLFPLYLLVGVIAMLVYRWGKVELTDGQEILLDIVFWPFMLYFWLRYGKGL